MARFMAMANMGEALRNKEDNPGNTWDGDEMDAIRLRSQMIQRSQKVSGRKGRCASLLDPSA